MKRLIKNTTLIVFFMLVFVIGFSQKPNCNQGQQNKFNIDSLYKKVGELLNSIFIQSTQPVDPNEIIGLDGYDAIGSNDTFRWVAAMQTLAYTVYFENDADLAMAAASKVTINVPLHPRLNYATLGIGSFGFGSHIFAVEGSPSSYQTRIDLRDSLGIFLDVVAGLDIVHNEAFWIFQSIDPATGLPPTDINLGFLPINDSLHSGEGFVTFTIKPNSSVCVTEDTITATASIVFDVNEAIPTNTWLNTVDAFPPTSTLSMVQSSADQLTATFSGEDDEGGCGVKQFKLYCSQNEGAYQLYGIYPVGTTPQIPLETGIEYRFFVLAEDNVGNCEPMKNQPEFTIGTNFVTLAVNSFPAEAGSTTGAGTYSVNETAELTATAAEGYHFVHWMQQGAVVSTQDPYSLSVTQNQTYTAYFERDAYTLQTVAATGSVITVTDLNGNEVPSGSTILHFDKLIVSTDTADCYVIESVLLNGVAYMPGDTIYVTDSVTLTTTTEQIVTFVEVQDTVCQGSAYEGYGFIIAADSTFASGLIERTVTVPSVLTGCDSIVTLHLTVNPADHAEFTEVVCGSYAWNDSVYTRSGDYVQTFTNASGCDSVVTLHLTVNYSNTGDTTAVACDRFDWYEHTNITSSCDNLTHTFTNANGCDSVVTLHLTVNYSNTGDTTAVACDRFDWYEHNNITSSCDNLTHTFTNAHGCDSVVTLHLTVNYSNTGDTTAIACDRFDWYEHNNITSSCDNLTHTFTNAHGCDSIVTLHLTVNHTTYGQETVTACDSFNWHGSTYTQSGDYPFVTTNAANCDSVVTLHLTVNYSNTGDTTAVACDRFDWYEHNNITSSCDNLTHTFTNANGCDSVVTLHLTVNYSNTGDTTAVACDRFDWYEHNNITSSCDNLTHTFTNAHGCDSVVTLHLTVNYSNTGDTTAVACNRFDWYEHTNITSSCDNLTHTFTNANGCDSVVTLHLTVNYSNTGDTTAIACDRFDWYEHTNITSSCDNLTHTFTNANGCDSVVTLHLTVNYSNTGDTTAIACDRFDWYEHTNITSSCDNLTHTFTNANGCDSVVTLHLTVNYSNTGDTTAVACNRFDWYEHNNITSSCDNLTHTFTNAHGCDSVVTLHLTVNYSNTGDTTAVACDRFDWYEHNNITSSCDNLTHTFTNAHGCDSVVTLHLTVNYSNTGDTTAVACDRFDWYEHNNITSSCDNLTHTFTNANGCDSVVTLHLTVNYSNTGDTTAVACDRFDWYEHNNITSSCDNLTHTFTNAHGCDSVVTLHLTVNYSNTGDTTAIACDRFDWYEHNNITSSCDNLTHTFTNANGCDSVVTLHLTVNYSNTGDTTAVACDRFDWYEHNNITSSCDNLTHTFTNAHGCDSVVTLHLTVNYSNTGDTTAVACDRFDWYEHNNITSSCDNLTHTFTNANGCDSVVTLHLTVNYSNTGDTTAVACDRFDWYEHNNITSSCDNLTHTFTNAHGCDSVVTLHLTVNYSNTGDTTAVACNRFDWYEHNNITSSCDNLTHTFTNAHGCDSVVTLHLTVNYSNTGDTTAVACDRFDWYEHNNITSSCDNLTHTFTNAHGCDSVVTLHLTVNYSNTGDTTAVACDRFDWYEHTNITSSCDNLTHTFTNAHGCDSVVTLHLTVNYSNTGDTTAVACDRFDWYEHNNITSSCDNLTHTFTNAHGCDSVVTLHLTVNYSNTGDTTAVACDRFDWYEHTNITSSCDNLTHTFTNAHGCDSVVTLHLTVNYAENLALWIDTCESYTWNGQTFYLSGDYTYSYENENGCIQVDTLHLTIDTMPVVEIIGNLTITQGESTTLTATENEHWNYIWNTGEISSAITVSPETDTEYTVTVSNGSCSVTSSAVVIVNVGINDHLLNQINVHPNPTNDVVIISSDDVLKVEVFDMQGQLVYECKKTNRIDLSPFATGVYSLRIQVSQGTVMRKVIKRN